MENFRSNPVIECHDKGFCNYFDQVTSFWLSVIDESEMFLKPRQQTLKADLTSKVSRCVHFFLPHSFELLINLLSFFFFIIFRCTVCRKTAQIKTVSPIDLFPDASALIAQQQEEIHRQLPWQNFNPSPSQPHRRRQRVRNGGKRRATQQSG